MKKSIFNVIVAVVVACAVAAGVCCLGHASRDKTSGKWFGNFKNISEWSWTDEKPQDDTSEDKLVISCYSLTADEYADYGISEQAIKAGVLTANYQPSNTTNKRTGWTWRWAGNEWSKDKVITDFVDFVAGDNYAPELRYSVKQPFGDTIIVEAISRANSIVKAATEIDYLARYKAIFNDSDLYLDYECDLDIFSGLCTQGEIYSIVPDSYVAEVTLEINTGLIDYVFELYGDTDDSIWSFSEVSGVLDYHSWYLYFVNNIGDSDICVYFSQIAPGECFMSVNVEITCFYEGEKMYTFTDSKDAYWTDEALELMSVPPTSVTVPDKVVI